jgi:polar amino acid transport system substrate-binding protein
MIAFGRIDLFICEETVCRYLLDEHIADHPELANVSAMPRTVGEVRGFRAAFSRQHPQGEALRDEFNKVLADLTTSDSD